MKGKPSSDSVRHILRRSPVTAASRTYPGAKKCHLNLEPAPISDAAYAGVVRPVLAQVSVNISVGVPPPELPVYEQPPIPGDGYVWTPGYWAWSDDDQDYYWVPGTWYLPRSRSICGPRLLGLGRRRVHLAHGLLGSARRLLRRGQLRLCYGGSGYEGGYWQGGRMYYNRS